MVTTWVVVAAGLLFVALYVRFGGDPADRSERGWPWGALGLVGFFLLLGLSREGVTSSDYQVAAALLVGAAVSFALVNFMVRRARRR